MAMDAKQVAAGAMAAGYGQDQALAMAQQCMTAATLRVRDERT